MRPLTALVLLEALVLAVLLAFWLGGEGSGANSVELAAMPDAPGETRALSSSAQRSISKPRDAEAEQAETPAIADAAFGIVAHGVVLDEQRRPIEGASLTFFRDGVYESGTSARGGAFAIADLASGEWDLLAEAMGFATQRRKVELNASPWQRLEVVLRPWYSVKVRFATPSGEPLPADMPWDVFQEPLVVATLEPLSVDVPLALGTAVRRISAGSWFSASRPDPRNLGQKELVAAGFAGELHLNQDPPLCASLLFGPVLLQTKRIEADEHELTFEIDVARVQAQYGEVRFRLVDGASGAPLAGVVARVEMNSSHSIPAKTDEEGRARVEMVIPGLGTLSASPRERAEIFVGVRMPPGGKVDLGDLVALPQAVIAVRVVDERGRGVPNASMRCLELDREGLDARYGQLVPVGNQAEGRFTLRGAGRHRYALFASRGPSVGAFATVDARNEDPPEILFTLLPTTRVVLRGNLEKPVERVLRVLAADGSLLRRIAFAETFAPLALQLPPGEYTAEFLDASGALLRTSSLIVASDPVSLEIP